MLGCGAESATATPTPTLPNGVIESSITLPWADSSSRRASGRMTMSNASPAMMRRVSAPAVSFSTVILWPVCFSNSGSMSTSTGLNAPPVSTLRLSAAADPRLPTRSKRTRSGRMKGLSILRLNLEENGPNEPRPIGFQIRRQGLERGLVNGIEYGPVEGTTAAAARNLRIEQPALSVNHERDLHFACGAGHQLGFRIDQPVDNLRDNGHRIWARSLELWRLIDLMATGRWRQHNDRQSTDQEKAPLQHGSGRRSHHVGLQRRVHEGVCRRLHSELAAKLDHLAAEPRQLDAVAALEVERHRRLHGGRRAGVEGQHPVQGVGR